MLHTLGTNLLLAVRRGVGVESEEDLLVLERVLLLDTGTLGAGVALRGTDDGLDFGRVDQTADVSLCDLSGRSREDAVEGLEGSAGPDDEAAHVATRSQLEEVKSTDGAGLNTSNVAESVRQLLAVNLRVEDDEGTTALSVTATTELALSSAELAAGLDLADISTGTDALEKLERGAGLGDTGVGEDLGVHDEGHLRDGLDLVAAGHDKGRAGGRGQRGGGREALLVEVDLLVPLSPDLGRGEHASGSAHVTERSLTSTVGSSSGDTGDTGNGTT